MKLFLISQTQKTDYNTYYSAVVAAPDEATARLMDPCDGTTITDWAVQYTWCSSPEHVKVRYLGEAKVGTPKGAICSSFNAG